MEDDLERTGVETGQGKHNQVLVVAMVEERRQVGGLALVERQERLHCGAVGKGQDDDRRRSNRLRPGEQ